MLAAGDGGNTGISIGGYDTERKPFVYVDFTCGAWTALRDGLDGNSHMFANMASSSIEVTEAEHPMQFLAYELMPDKAGAGKYRGGRSCAIPFSNRRHAPGPRRRLITGPSACTAVSRGPSNLSIRRREPAAAVEAHHDNQEGRDFRHVLAGAGGWGDPLERDPSAVLRDVRNELLSPEKALANYGVVLDLKGWKVDEAATVRRRAEIAKSRGWTEVPRFNGTIRCSSRAAE